MSQERRGVRPFDSLERTQSLLNQLVRVQSPPIPDGYQPNFGGQGLKPIGLSEGTGSIAAASGTLNLSADEYMTNAVGLYFGTDQQAWSDLINELDDELLSLFGFSYAAPVSLLVTATNSRLNQMVELLNEPYSHFVDADDWRRIIVPPGDSKMRPRPLRMPADGCIITVQLMLNEDLPESHRAAGKPWRKGSWLCKVAVRVRAARGSGLSPRPLTASARERFGVGPFSSIYIHFPSGYEGLSTVSDLAGHMNVFIDENALMVATEVKNNGTLTAPAAEGILQHWVMDTYRSLVMAFLRDDSLTAFDLDHPEAASTYLYSLLQQVSEHGDIGIEESFLVLCEHPERFIALIENSLNKLATDHALLRLRAGAR